MAGYSGTPLSKKLGLKEGMKLHAINPPANYIGLLGPLPAGLSFCKTAKGCDMIHLFVQSMADLGKLHTLKDQVNKDGMIWVSWEKKKTKAEGAINENKVREAALLLGLVDIKVCAIDDEWSGLKLVWRKELR
jgi:hypothetical protein